MLVESLVSMLINVFDKLTSAIDIPALPASVDDMLWEVWDYLYSGAVILMNYTHWDYLRILFGIVLAIEAAFTIYKLVMWILRKIPMLGIS